MAKKTKASKATASALVPAAQLQPLQPFAINPFGPTKQRVIKRSNVVASEFELDDGTKLLVTPIVSDVRRALDQYSPDGNPLYFLTMGQTITTVAPAKLKVIQGRQVATTKKRTTKKGSK